MLETTAQIIVEDQLPIDDSLQGSPIQIVPISGPFEIQEGHSIPHFQQAPALEVQDSVEMKENPNLILEINLDGQLAGAPDFDPEKARMIEESISVSEDELKEKEQDKDKADDSAKSKKRERKRPRKELMMNRVHL